MSLHTQWHMPNPHARPPQSPWKRCAKTAVGGFAMGTLVGVSIGVLFGGMQVMSKRFPGPRIPYIAKMCLSSGAAFGTFLCVGSVIRGC